jgi:hypothetical protein
MSSLRQLEANRRNAVKSTGPTSAEGKQRSRCNAVRHGLTAETVIGALEDAEDYKAFETAVTADYDAQSAVERELVLRLASLLWRLRRATAMETGLFQIQAVNLQEFREARQSPPDSHKLLVAMPGAGQAQPFDRHSTSQEATNGSTAPLPLNCQSNNLEPPTEIARCFLRLANLPSAALDRLSRYEANLWRQVRQILFTLDALDRRKPQERKRLAPETRSGLAVPSCHTTPYRTDRQG